jgi:hypothetical protein
MSKGTGKTSNLKMRRLHNLKVAHKKWLQERVTIKPQSAQAVNTEKVRQARSLSRLKLN